MEQQIEILLKKAAEYERMKTHLSNMLDEWEAQHETGTQFSPESIDEYIAAAEFMGKHGRLTGALDVIKSLNS
jgi:hypothetical protein